MQTKIEIQGCSTAPSHGCNHHQSINRSCTMRRAFGARQALQNSDQCI